MVDGIYFSFGKKFLSLFFFWCDTDNIDQGFFLFVSQNISCLNF